MSDPLDSLRTEEVAILLAIALGGTYLLAPLFPKLKPPAARGIFGFELTWRTGRAREILDDWEAHGLIAQAKTSIALDLPFIPLYSSTVALAAILLGRAVGANAGSPGTAETVAALAAYAAWMAGVLDLAENAGLLSMLAGRTNQPVPALTSLVSAAKWALIVAAGLAVLVLLVWSVVGLSG